jgi:V/A-type H+-transporting ATPase subunit B
MKPEYGNISMVQKIRAPKKLLEIRTNAGTTVRATQDHRFLADRERPKMVPASELKEGDNIFSLRKLEVKEQKRPTLLEILASSEREFILTLKKERMSELRTMLKEKFGNLKRACENLGLNYIRTTSPTNILDAKGLVRACELLGIGVDEANRWIDSFSIKNGIRMHVRWREANADLLYLLGLVASDGSVVGPHHVSFTNRDEVLLRTYITTFKKLFPELHPEITRDSHGTVAIQACSTFLFELAKFFGLTTAFERIFELDEELIAAFLAGYFDGDGNCDVSFGRIRYRKKAVSERDRKIVKRLAQLTRRLGIPATVAGFTQSRGSFGEGNAINEISISGEYARKFAGMLLKRVQHPKKKKLLKSLLIKPTRPSKFDVVPRACASLLAKIRSRYGIDASQIDRSSYVLAFERGAITVSKQKFAQWVARLEDLVGDHDEGIRELKKLCSEDFILERIISVREVPCEEEYVYDLTVPGYGNFIVESGLISSNCEGQLVMDRELQRKGIYPPMNVLPSLSRLMKDGIGKGRTREDHSDVSNQLYAAYAEGRDLRSLVAVVGEEALTDRDRRYLTFADRFEREFVNQGWEEDRSIETTLNLGWELLSMLPESELKRVDPRFIEKYLRQAYAKNSTNSKK